MTSDASKWLHETFPPEVARGILAGRPLRIHAVRVSLVREGDVTGFAIDTPPRDGRSKKWVQTTQKIARILKGEFEQLPPEVEKVLAVIAHLLPGDTPVPLVTVETWVSMRDDGGTWWEVTALLTPAAGCLPKLLLS